MVSPTRIVVALLLMLLACPSWATNLSVKLDSDEVTAGDTVNLTVTVDEQSFNKSPDFSPLKQNFEILSNQQSSQYSMINGSISSSTTWTLTLLPKSQGYVAIPPLQYGDQTSKPLKLHVTAQRQVNPASTQDVIFLDAQVDKKDVYVQEQVIYTVRLYRRIDLHDSSYTPPKVDNAVMEALGNQREYTTTVNGRGYKIVELRYVIFPQKSGELEIPPASIVGTIYLGRGSSSFMFDPFNGKQIHRVSPEITIHVKPKPDSYPADQPWLPARSLKLKESWTPSDNDFKVGDPVTRQITIEAEGLAPSVLPPIKAPSFDNVKVYPDQPQTKSNIGPHGMLSTRVESQAMIATATGNVKIPPVTVTWWDVDEDRVKQALLPGRTVKITGSAAHAQTDAAVQAPPSASTSEAAPASLGNNDQHNAWRWISIILVVLWIATLVVVVFLLRRRREQPTIQAEPVQSPFTKAAEKSAHTQFQTACQNNDARTARSQLLEWYRQLYKTQNIHNLDDVLAQTPDSGLAQQLRQLDTALYRSANKDSISAWQGSGLADAVQTARKKQSEQQTSKKSHLEPLFPA